MNDFTAAERALMDEAAAAIVRRRLAVPAMMALETVVPMNVITSSMLYTLAPVWKAALPASRIEELARLLERREAIPEFIRALDAGEQRRRQDERARRAETR